MVVDQPCLPVDGDVILEEVYPSEEVHVEEIEESCLFCTDLKIVCPMEVSAKVPKEPGLMTPQKLSADLAAIVGVKEASHTGCMKLLWAYLKENELQDPGCRQYFTPDSKMALVFGTEKIQGFSMAKYLKTHLTPIEDFQPTEQVSIKSFETAKSMPTNTESVNESKNPVIKNLRETEILEASSSLPLRNIMKPSLKTKMSPAKIMKEKKQIETENKAKKQRFSDQQDLKKDSKPTSKAITVELKKTPKRTMIVLGDAPSGLSKEQLKLILKRAVVYLVIARASAGKHKPDKLTVHLPMSLFKKKSESAEDEEGTNNEKPTMIHSQKSRRCKHCSTQEKRKMTEYHCEDCKEPLCAFPCFLSYHEENGIACKGFSVAMETQTHENEGHEDQPQDEFEENVEPALSSATAKMEDPTPEPDINPAHQNENESIKKPNQVNSKMIKGPDNHLCIYCKGTKASKTNKRRMTKFHCGGCKTSLCRAPCFNLYHNERGLKCHLNADGDDEIFPDEMDEGKRRDLENAKLKARNKMLFHQLIANTNKSIKKEEEFRKKLKEMQAKEKQRRKDRKAKWKAKEKKLRKEKRQLYNKWRAALYRIQQKNVKIKTMGKRLAVKRSLISILEKKLKNVTSNKQLPKLLKQGIQEFLLSKNFTKAQVKVLMNKQKRARFSREDILNNLYIRSISPRAYEYLRKFGPLLIPSRNTMERWLNGMMECKNGFNEDAIKVQRLKLEASENPLYKFSQIVFDEVHIKESIELDRKNQEVIGPCKSLQTVMIRGLACD